MPVYLRERKLAKGRKRYFLDIYHNNKRTYEFQPHGILRF